MAAATTAENPYWPADDVRGIGVEIADQVAAELGVAKDALVRVRARVSRTFARVMDDDHCDLPVDDILRIGAELVEVMPERL